MMMGKQQAKNKRNPSDFLAPVTDGIEIIVDVYLQNVIRPFFLVYHEQFYNNYLENSVLVHKLQHLLLLLHDETNLLLTYYTRILLIFPTTLVLLSCQYTLIPSILVLTAGFVHGTVLLRFPGKNKKEEEDSAKARTTTTSARTTDANSRAVSPTLSDADSFEVVTTGSDPHSIPSWVETQRCRTYDTFLHDITGKAFMIPCWIMLLHAVPSSSSCSRWLSPEFLYFVLFSLIVAETTNTCFRFRTYYTNPGLPVPQVVGANIDLLFSKNKKNAIISSDQLDKVQQTLETVGTALFMLPITRYVGLVVLMSAMPVAYELVRRQLQSRVVYVYWECCDQQQPGAYSHHHCSLDHNVLKFWMQAAALGNQLLVGIPAAGVGTDSRHNAGEQHDAAVLTACAVSCVHSVIAEAPAVDMLFMETHGIDCVLLPPGPPHQHYVMDTVVAAKCVWQVGDDGIVRQVQAKVEGKTE